MSSLVIFLIFFIQTCLCSNPSFSCSPRTPKGFSQEFVDDRNKMVSFFIIDKKTNELLIHNVPTEFPPRLSPSDIDKYGAYRDSFSPQSFVLDVEILKEEKGLKKKQDDIIEQPIPKSLILIGLLLLWTIYIILSLD